MSFRDYEPYDLARADFKIHQLESIEKDTIENTFAGYVSDVLGRINAGKEATVYLCRGTTDDRPYLAAKVFRARHFRHFDTDHNYRNLGRMKDRRLAKAMGKRSRKGETAFHRQWVRSEYDMLVQLHELGVRVPEPVARFPDGLLMEFIGDDTGPAPRLANCRYEPDTLQLIGDAVRADIRTMLAHDIVHGDLSAYNILMAPDGPVIIDVPQAMDLNESPDARSVMHRDLANLSAYFARQGVLIDFEALLYDVR